MMLFGFEMLSMRQNELSFTMQSEAQRENAIIFEEIFNRFSNLAITRYDWSGLPETVDERLLNIGLYLYGKVAFFEHEDFGLLALPCSMGSSYNINYEPTEVTAFSFGFSRLLTEGGFAYVRNDPSATPTAFPVFEYTRRMADILRSIDVLCIKLKQPFILFCDEKERLTYINAIKKIRDNEIMVLGMKDFGMRKDRDIELIQTPTPNSLDQLWASYYAQEQILLNALGIETVGREKKERLLTDEVNSNNMLTMMSLETNLKELQQGCERVNKMFGTDIWVDAKTMADYRQEVERVGQVYDTSEGPGSEGV